MATEQIDVVSVSVNNIACIDPSADGNDYLKASLKGIFPINGFRMISGKEFGYGYFLLLRKDISSLQNSNTVTIVCGSKTITINDLVFVESWSSTPNTVGDNDLMIVKLADCRFLSTNSKRRLNVDPVPPNEAICINNNEDFEETWTDIVTAYWEDSNSKDLPLTENAEYPNVLIRDVVTAPYDSSWISLTNILDLISHRVYKSASGFSVQNLSRLDPSLPQKINDAEPRKISLQQDKTSKEPFLPSSIRVKFRQLENGLLPNNYIEDLEFIFPYDNSADSSNSVFNDHVLDVVAYNIYDRFYDDEDETYKNDLEQLSEKIANLFFGAFENHNKYNAIYFGAIDFDHSPEVDTIVWYHDLSDGAYKTKIKSIDLKDKVWPKIREVMPPFDKANIFKFMLLEDLYTCSEAEACLVDDDCNPIDEVTVRDCIGVAILEENDQGEFAPEGAMGYGRFISEECSSEDESESLTETLEVISLGIGCCSKDSVSESSESLSSSFESMSSSSESFESSDSSESSESISSESDESAESESVSESESDGSEGSNDNDQSDTFWVRLTEVLDPPDQVNNDDPILPGTLPGQNILVPDPQTGELIFMIGEEFNNQTIYNVVDDIDFRCVVPVRRIGNRWFVVAKGGNIIAFAKLDSRLEPPTADTDNNDDIQPSVATEVKVYVKYDSIDDNMVLLPDPQEVRNALINQSFGPGMVAVASINGQWFAIGGGASGFAIVRSSAPGIAGRNEIDGRIFSRVVDVLTRADTGPPFDGELVTTGEQIEVFNPYTFPVLSTGQRIGSATQDANGNWWITGSDCFDVNEDGDVVGTV